MWPHNNKPYDTCTRITEETIGDGMINLEEGEMGWEKELYKLTQKKKT